MNGQGKLGNIAFTISMCVIIGMALTFAILFFLYGRYKCSNIRNGHEDDKLGNLLKKRYKNIWDKPRLQLHTPIKENTYKKQGSEPDNIKTYSLIPIKEEQQNIQNESIYDNILIDRKRSKKHNWVLNVFFIVLYVVLGVFLITSITFKINDKEFYFGNTTYMTIMTGSMEKQNEDNKYLKENNLNNQIEQYSLIGIDKISKDSDLKLYDVVAFKHEDIKIVHRIIRIYTNSESGVTYYTTRGDSNIESFSWELTLTKDDIIGKYNGFQNYGLGVTFTYLQSGIGLIAIASALAFLFTYNFTESKIEKTYEERILAVGKLLDEEMNKMEIVECLEEQEQN